MISVFLNIFQGFEIQFERYETEGCDKDYISIHTSLESDPIMKLCDPINEVLRIAESYIVIRFRTDGAVQDAGFRFVYKSAQSKFK